MNITNINYLPIEPINILDACKQYDNKLFIIFSALTVLLALKLYIFPIAIKKAKRLELEAYYNIIELGDYYLNYIIVFATITIWYLLSPFV